MLEEYNVKNIIGLRISSCVLHTWYNVSKYRRAKTRVNGVKDHQAIKYYIKLM